MPRRRPRRRNRERPQRRNREEDSSLPKFIYQLQYLAGIMASCYLERQYRKGGDPGFLLLGLGAASIGAYALGECIGNLLDDAWEQKIGAWQGDRPA